MTLRGIPFEPRKELPVTYKGQAVGMYIADIVVDGKIILEVKAISALNKAHETQAHNYWQPPACAWPSSSTSAHPPYSGNASFDEASYCGSGDSATDSMDFTDFFGTDRRSR